VDWQIVISPRAERELKRLTPVDLGRVRAALDALNAFPSRGDLRKLAGMENQWRLRVGNWRILVRPNFQDRVVVVLRVLPRAQSYRR
jgi:mRNA interferase RelE/StbE